MPRRDDSPASQDIDVPIAPPIAAMVAMVFLLFLSLAALITGNQKASLLVNTTTNGSDLALLVFEDIGSGFGELPGAENGIQTNDPAMKYLENATPTTLADVEVKDEATSQEQTPGLGTERGAVPDIELPRRLRRATTAKRPQSIPAGSFEGDRLSSVTIGSNNALEPCRKVDFLVQPADMGLHHVTPKIISLGYCAGACGGLSSRKEKLHYTKHGQFMDWFNIRGAAPFLPGSSCVAIAYENIRVMVMTKNGTFVEEILPSASVTRCECR